MDNLETGLSKHLTSKQWKKLRKFCKENGLLLNEESLEFGSLFLTVKMAFVAGWDANETPKETPER